MKAIYKYNISPMAKITLPLDSQILSVEEQNGSIVVYAMVDTSIPFTESYEFLVYGTGHTLSHEISNYTFLGTVKINDGIFMFHVFYRK